MKVAIIQDWLNGMRGGEKVLEELITLYPDCDIYTLFYEPDKISAKINDRKPIVSILQNLPFTQTKYRYYMPLFPWAIARFDLSSYDLIISSSHFAAKGIRVPNGLPHVCYCHSPAKALWHQYETYFGGENRWKLRSIIMRLFIKNLRRWDIRTSKTVNQFVANGIYIAEKIKEIYNQDAIVCNPPVNVDKYKISETGPKDYFLIVSALEPYKRVDLAVDVFNKLGKRLIIAGRGSQSEILRDKAGPTIEFRDWVTDEELVELFSEAQAFLMPGLEDFGITPLESMASGRPVIAIREGGVLETVIEGKTGVFFDEPTVECLKNAVESFISADYDPQILRAHAEKFGEQRFHREMKKIVDDALTQ